MKLVVAVLPKLLLVAALVAAGAARADSMPEAVVELPNRAVAPAALVSPLGTVATIKVQLREPDASALASVRQSNSVGLAKGLQVGIEREVGGNPVADKSATVWSDLPGGKVAHWEVTSYGARALRVGLELSNMSSGVEIRFVGRDSDAVYGPFSAGDVVGQSIYWSPVLLGETAFVEIFVREPAARPDVAVARISHLFADPVNPEAEKLLKDGSASCNIDLVCRSPGNSALASTAKAVAKMVFQKNGGSFLCTGTMLNSADVAFTPYFYTANHCISAQSVANTLTTHWFYDRTGCGSGSTSSSYVQVGGGATLLYASEPADASFMRLKGTPPAASILAGWNSTTLATGTELTAVHHPKGDWTKVSLGSLGSLVTVADPGGSFLKVFWSSGVTEGGSSGSGVFTFANGQYQFRGGLLGGASACGASAANMYDYYSRFDQVYPQIRQYLNAGAAPPAPVVTEFYNTILDNYFITADAGEASAIDNGGAGPGWSRTGNTFKSGGSTQVCRFYGSQSPGPNSHFYTADAGECNTLRLLQQATPITQKRWNFESFDFATTVSTVLGCPAGTVAVYRAYNNGTARGVDSNHRITSNLSAINAVVARGWISEGIRMCAPQ